MFLKMFKQDVQRWIIPEEISDPALVTWSRTLRLLYRHMPLRAMLWFRFGSWCKSKRIPLLKGFVQRALYRWFGIEIYPGAGFCVGLYIANPIGIVIYVEGLCDNWLIM